MDSNQHRFEQLVNLVLDGGCADTERDELAQIVREHPEFVPGIVSELTLHCLLKWRSGNLTQVVMPIEVTTGPSPLEVKSPVSYKQVATRNFTWAIAAVLLLSAGFIGWRVFSVSQAANLAIAEIVDQDGVVWAKDSTALKQGNAIIPGRLASTSGEYTLQFRSGPTVRIAGPASLDIKSPMFVHLHRGQATASVPEQSIGFTITSPLVDVIDQGTQFGISVGEGETDVVVFSGKVDLRPNIGVDNGQTRLGHGEAVQVSQQGSIDRRTEIRRDVHGRWWTDDRAVSEGHVIASVSDNIHAGGGEDEFVCYQTTFEGLHEDALAFSDNPYHQWNGLTSAGLPEFLRGADYVKTFNDYRYAEDFELKVELAGPANLYVFFDDRVDTPDWLKASFEDTGVDIGLDEGPWLSQVEEKYRKWDTNTTAVGGGNSIDNVFSVWRRRCVNGGTVSLGNAGDWGADGIGLGGKGGRAMYGIAATPLNIDEVPQISHPAKIGN